MFRRPASRPSSPARPCALDDRILHHVLGGMMGGTPPINFPPYPPFPQRSFRFPIPPKPNPFHFAVATSGGTGRTPQHGLHADYHDGKFFASATALVPPMTPMPGMPLINGTSTSPVQNLELTAGFSHRW